MDQAKVAKNQATKTAPEFVNGLTLFVFSLDEVELIFSSIE